MTTSLKDEVREFWDAASCGEVYAQGDTVEEQYAAQAKARYELEPYIAEFAQFPSGRGKDVLEIGVGMGADHVEWAKSAPRSLTGLDLTPRAIEHTRNRLRLSGHDSHLEVGDAEHLSFDDESFDIVYSYGVLHHSPDTAQAISDVHRVLRTGGTARIMIYNRHSIMAAMLWVKYGLLAGRPLISAAELFARYCESPGTKGFTVREARAMCSGFARTDVRTCLSFSDLLQGEVGQRHRGWLLRLGKRFWPRKLIRMTMNRFGTQILITAVK
jgi:SAM-dependent methyltransferase